LAGEELVVNIIGDASKLKSELEKAGKNVTSFSDKVTKIGKIATVAGGAVTAAFGAIVTKTAEVGDKFDKMSKRTGIAVEDLSSLAYAAEISGTNINTLENSLRFLARAMDDTSKGTGEAKDAFEELGISVVDTEGNLRPTVDVMKEAATKLAAMTDETKQVALATDIFGARYGTQLLPLLKEGGEGIEELMNKAKDLGITMSTEAATAAAEFTDRMTDLKGSLAGAGRTIGDTLIPAIIPLVEKVTEIVGKVREWVEKNKPLAESIFKMGAALGATLAVLGPIAAILPSLISGFQLLAPAMLPFAVGGAIVLGFKKLSEYLGDIREKAFKLKEGIEEWSLEQLDTKIAELEGKIKSLSREMETSSKEINTFGGILGISGDKTLQLANQMETLQFQLKVLKEQREKLTKAEEEGIDVTEEKLKLDEEIAKGQEAINKLLDEWNKKVKLYTKYTSEANEVNIDLLDGMHRYTQVAKEWKQVSLYFMGTRDSLKAVEKATDEVTVSEETMAKATGKVYDKWYELAKLWDVRPDLQKYFTTSSKALEEFGNKTKEVTKTSWKLWKDFYDNLKRKAGTTMTILQDGIEDFVGGFKTGLSNAISSLLNMGKTNAEIKEKMAEENTTYTEEMTKLQEEYNQAVMAGDDEAAANAIQKMRDIKEEHAKTMQALQDQLVTPKTVWEQFWESLKQSAINALADIIASWAWKAIIGFVGWILPFNKGGGIGYALGRAVKMATGGIAKKIKGYQSGGLTDTVPAMLTPGEYVISKPMVDAIKRFKAIPSNLIEAISRGLPTPVPAFATGGPVGTPNIASTAGFGTNINVYISGNNISNEIDLKHLAIKVSDEIVRKLNQRRRY